MSSVRWRLALNSFRAGGCNSAFLSVYKATNLVLPSQGSPINWSFWSHVLSGTAFLAKLETGRQNTSHTPKKELSSAGDVGGWSSRMGMVVCRTFLTIFWAHYMPEVVISFRREAIFLNVRVIRAPLRRLRMLQTCTIGSSRDSEVLTMSLR